MFIFFTTVSVTFSHVCKISVDVPLHLRPFFVDWHTRSTSGLDSGAQFFAIYTAEIFISIVTEYLGLVWSILLGIVYELPTSTGPLSSPSPFPPQGKRVLTGTVNGYCVFRCRFPLLFIQSSLVTFDDILGHQAKFRYLDSKNIHATRRIARVPLLLPRMTPHSLGTLDRSCLAQLFRGNEG